MCRRRDSRAPRDFTFVGWDCRTGESRRDFPLTSPRVRGEGASRYPPYSGLIPANLITLPHLSVSSAISLPKSADRSHFPKFSHHTSPQGHLIGGLLLWEVLILYCHFAGGDRIAAAHRGTVQCVNYVLRA